MAYAKEDTEWNRTAVQLAMFANANRDPKKAAPCHPDDFHPIRQLEKRKHRPSIADLKPYVNKLKVE